MIHAPDLGKAGAVAARNASAFLGYVVSAFLVKWYFSRYGMLPSPFWLPAGVALVAAYTGGWRTAPGIFVGSVVAQLGVFDALNWFQAFLVSSGNTIAPVAAGILLRRWIGSDDPFGSIAKTFGFLAIGAILHGALAGTGGTLSLWADSGLEVTHLPIIWLRWALSDAGGTLIVAPLLMMTREFGASLPVLRRNWIEAAVCAAVAVTMATSLTLRGAGPPTSDSGSVFLVMLPLLWAAVRFPLLYAYALMVTVIGIVIVTTMAGPNVPMELYRSQALIAFAEMSAGLSAVVLVLGAALNEQHRAKEQLRRANLDLERRVEARTAELRDSRRKLEQMAFFDTLTGLGNRRMFEDRFDIMAAMARRKGDQFALAMVDLDHFKEVNDEHGHDVGDAVLQEAARRLVASVRQTDSVSRLGGDEFAIVLAEAKNQPAIDLVCQRIVESFSRPVMFRGLEMKVGASVGVAIFPAHGATISELYRSADHALYAAKRGGRNTWRWFDPALLAGRHAEPVESPASKTQS